MKCQNSVKLINIAENYKFRYTKKYKIIKGRKRQKVTVILK